VLEENTEHEETVYENKIRTERTESIGIKVVERTSQERSWGN
jgi:hypothetical protein